MIRIERYGIETLRVSPTALFVALHEVGNPGNLGTIIRTVDAVGGSGIALIGGTTDPYHPSAVKASVGTLFRLPIVHAANIEDVLAWCAAQQISVITTSARAAHDHWDVTYPIALARPFWQRGARIAARDRAARRFVRAHPDARRREFAQPCRRRRCAALRNAPAASAGIGSAGWKACASTHQLLCCQSRRVRW